MNIAIAPHAAKLPTGIRNAKDYPWWRELVAALNAEGHVVTQLGVKGEDRIDGVGRYVQGFPLDKLVDVIRECDTWISVDSWLPHFCATMRLQPGIVIWGQSNPKVWGYPTNINLLKSPEYLRPYQYAPWFDIQHTDDCFVEPDVVLEALHGRFATALA